MSSSETLLEIFKYTVPAAIVLGGTYMIIQKFLVAENQRKQMAIFQNVQDTTIKLRLQAYERMALFIERISPRNLIPRIFDPSMTVRDLQIAITISIRAEFEHNMSQQIYVSKNVWETVKNVKEQELSMVNQIAQKLDADAPAKELHLKILDIISKADDELPTAVALHIINDEVKTILQYGSY